MDPLHQMVNMAVARIGIMMADLITVVGTAVTRPCKLEGGSGMGSVGLGRWLKVV